MSEDTLDGMLSLAIRLAGEAGDLARSLAGKTAVEHKADTSVVTQADRLIETRLLDAVADQYPDHARCAEETASGVDPTRGAARFCWVIDPIDGTRNYVSGFPCYATSIAVLDRGEPVVAVVQGHQRNDVYAAKRGGGATLNDRPIHVRDVPDDDDVLVGIPSSKDRLTVGVLGRWIETRGLVLRNVGSTALHLAMVAAGSLSAAYCKRCKIWDVAAGALLVREAGGRITDPWGGSWLPFDLTRNPSDDLPYLAGAPSTHRRLLTDIPPAPAD